MNIGEASKETGVSERMIRHYEKIRLLPRAERTATGYRVYAAEDLARLSFIAKARDLGFPIEEIRKLLGLWSNSERSSAEVKRLALNRAAELEQKARAIAALRDALLVLAERCHGDDRPDCPIIDGLAS